MLPLPQILLSLPQWRLQKFPVPVKGALGSSGHLWYITPSGGLREISCTESFYSTVLSMEHPQFLLYQFSNQAQGFSDSKTLGC